MRLAEMAMGAAVSDDYQRGTRKKEEAKAFYSGILCTSKRLSRHRSPENGREIRVYNLTPQSYQMGGKSSAEP